jgi:choline transporter-like protein 2/4/5
MNNILRIGKVNVIGDVILLLGKLCVSLLCALFAFLMLDKHKYRSGHNKISSPLVPVLVSDHQSLQHMVEFLYLGAIWMKKLMSDERATFSLFFWQLSWALGYIVAKLFFAVVEMSIDTMVLSFCQDSEEHQGSAQYAPPLLMETLDEESELRRLTQGP